MEDAQLRQKIEELREKRGRTPSEPKQPETAGDFRKRRREERAARREDFYPPVSYGEPEDILPPELAPPPDTKPHREEGVVGSVFTMQAILALLLAILYVLAMSFSPEGAGAALRLIREKAQLDFSFRDSVYDAVGEVVGYLNELEITSSQPESSSTAGESDGMGGEYTPVTGTILPENCTFAPVVYTGAALFPIQGGGRLTSRFGFRDHPINGGGEFHTAVDIAAPQGTPVFAAFDGVVLKSEYNDSLGNHIILDHGNDFLSIYAHCDSLTAHAGMRVRQGECIARVGSTGDSTGFHLHFSLRYQGLYINPAYIFPKELHAAV